MPNVVLRTGEADPKDVVLYEWTADAAVTTDNSVNLVLYTSDPVIRDVILRTFGEQQVVPPVVPSFVQLPTEYPFLNTTAQKNRFIYPGFADSYYYAAPAIDSTAGQKVFILSHIPLPKRPQAPNLFSPTGIPGYYQAAVAATPNLGWMLSGQPFRVWRRTYSSDTLYSQDLSMFNLGWDTPTQKQEIRRKFDSILHSGMLALYTARPPIIVLELESGLGIAISPLSDKGKIVSVVEITEGIGVAMSPAGDKGRIVRILS